MAIIGVAEDRASVNNQGCAYNPNIVRQYLYNLTSPNEEIHIADLGNLILGQKVEDTYYALAEVVSSCLEQKITPIIIGGSNDLAIGCYKGYCNNKQIINLLDVDSHFDFISDQEPTTDQNFLHEIICSDPNYLFDYTLVGYQSYFTDPKAITLLNELHFEHMRLGLLQDNINNIEPMVRDCDMLVVDTDSIRQSDAPSSSSPHGLYGEQLCKIANYAGMSDKLSSICFLGNNVLNDLQGRTSHIIAHAIYYFIEGYIWRKHDAPYLRNGNHIQFRVQINNMSDEVVFYKSQLTDRWWIEVPCTDEQKIKYIKHYIVPCLYSDYQKAINNELPQRWIIAYNKLNN